MEYLFLRRKRTTATSERQRALLDRAAEQEWERRFAAAVGKQGSGTELSIYKNLLYQLELRQVFLDTELSLKKLSVLLETNQTYVSRVVNRCFSCTLKELVNRYRVEYAKELLRSGRCPLGEVPGRCGFASKSAFYAAFARETGGSPMRYVKYG